MRWIVASIACAITPASAEPSENPEVELARGSSPEAAVDAALATLGVPRCTTCTTVMRQPLSRDRELQIVTAPLYKDGSGTGDAIVLGSGRQWWSTIPYQLAVSDCGAGHCIDKQVTAIGVRQTAGHLRVTFTIAEDHHANESGEPLGSSTFDLVMDCTLGATPRCTAPFQRR